MPDPPTPPKRNPEFGVRLSALRRARGVTLRWLADEARMSDPYLCQLENGRSLPSAAILERLADALGLSMDELWHGGERAESLLSQARLDS